MPDIHRNIFAYYKGAAQSEQDREQQLEDNTTKALINTLDYCTPDVATKFLDWLGIMAPSRPDFVMQKRTIGEDKIRRKTRRLLLAIVGSSSSVNDSVCAQLPCKPVGDSRPDAWAYGENYVVLVESKIGESALTLQQMACHWDKLQPTCCKIVTWAQVHRFFVGLKEDLNDTKSRWLLDQFIQFLEWTGMTDFVGFREEMFEFFVQTEKDLDTKKWVRRTVEALADKVLQGDHGLKLFNSFYENKHIGNLAKESDHYWVAFGPADFRDYAHQTISLYEESLDVFVNVELLPAVKKLRKKIQADAALFRRRMCKLPSPFVVRIEERKQGERPRDFDYFPMAEVESYGLKDPQSPGFKYIQTLITETRLPYLSVRRRISRKEVLDLSKPNGEPLVREVLKILKGFHPLVELINQ